MIPTKEITAIIVYAKKITAARITKPTADEMVPPSFHGANGLNKFFESNGTEKKWKKNQIKLVMIPQIFLTASV